MSTKLFVSGIPFAFTNDDLRQMFESSGEVSEAVVVTDRMSGRSRGFGFVTMATPEAMTSAISSLDNSDVQGRTIHVSEARPQAPRTGGDRGNDRGGDRGGFRPRRESY